MVIDMLMATASSAEHSDEGLISEPLYYHYRTSTHAATGGKAVRWVTGTSLLDAGDCYFTLLLPL